MDDVAWMSLRRLLAGRGPVADRLRNAGSGGSNCQYTGPCPSMHSKLVCRVWTGGDAKRGTSCLHAGLDGRRRQREIRQGVGRRWDGEELLILEEQRPHVLAELREGLRRGGRDGIGRGRDGHRCGGRDEIATGDVTGGWQGTTWQAKTSPHSWNRSLPAAVRTDSDLTRI